MQKNNSIAKTTGAAEIRQMMQPLTAADEENNEAKSENNDYDGLRSRKYSDGEDARFGSFVNLGLRARRLSNDGESDSTQEFESDSSFTTNSSDSDSSSRSSVKGFRILVDPLDSNQSETPKGKLDNDTNFTSSLLK